MVHLRNINFFFCICVIALANNSTSAFFDWRCSPVETGVEIDDAVHLQAECSKDQLTASWKSNDDVGLVNIEYHCYPAGEAPTGLTTILESFSERTTHSVSVPVDSSDNAATECIVLGCYFDDFFYEEYPIAQASCTIGGYPSPSPSSSTIPSPSSLATLTPSSSTTPSPSASPSPSQSSDCNCDCNTSVVIKYIESPTATPRNDDTPQGNTISKRNVEGTSQETNNEKEKLELITFGVLSVMGMAIICLVIANIVLVMKMKKSHGYSPCDKEKQFI